MPKVLIRQEAIDDLNSIWDYTFEKWSEKQADFNKSKWQIFYLKNKKLY